MRNEAVPHRVRGNIVDDVGKLHSARITAFVDRRTAADRLERPDGARELAAVAGHLGEDMACAERCEVCQILAVGALCRRR